MKSKFKFQAFLPALLLVPILGILIFLFTKLFDGLPIILYLLFLLLTFTCVWLFFGELRTKIIRFEVFDDRIIYRRYYGLGYRKIIYVNKIEGFVTSEIYHGGKVIEYLYLISENNKGIKMSEFYHGNYSELKTKLASNLKNLGKEKYTLLKELKGIFQ